MSRPANAVVPVAYGNIEAAIKRLRKKLQNAGVLSLFKQTSRLYAYTAPSPRRREKSMRARKKARRAAMYKSRPREMTLK